MGTSQADSVDDLSSGRIGGGPINTKLGYDLMANLSEVEKHLSTLAPAEVVAEELLKF